MTEKTPTTVYAAPGTSLTAFLVHYSVHKTFFKGGGGEFLQTGKQWTGVITCLITSSLN